MSCPLFWWNVVARTKKGRFGTLLGLTPKGLRGDGGTLIVEHLSDDVSIVSVEVPRWCCSDADGRIRLSAALGMMDEASTYAGICAWDRFHRPGVSIQLAGKTVHPRGFIDAGAGERIHIRTTRVKVGKTIAFVKASIERDTNVLIRCSHIKFMPMGFPLDHVFRPKVKNISVPLIERIARSMPLHDHRIPESIDGIFDLAKNLKNDAGIKTAMIVSESHGNPLGSIHGGASVMLAELAAERRMEQFCKENNLLRPRWIKTNLVRGIDCSSGQVAEIDVISEEETLDSSQERTNITTSTIRNEGKICSDTIIQWS